MTEPFDFNEILREFARSPLPMAEEPRYREGDTVPDESELAQPEPPDMPDTENSVVKDGDE